MDATKSSRERNNSSIGTLTRNRSQIFFHRSRSGMLRPDSGRRHKPYELPPYRRRTRRGSSKYDDNDDDVVLEKRLCKKTKLNRETAASPSSAGEEDELSRVLMKDLRARRVYSPQSSGGACSALVTNVISNGSGVDSDIGDRRLAGLGFGLKPSVDNDGCEEGSKLEVESDNLGKVVSPECQKKSDEVNSTLRLVFNEHRYDKDSDLYAGDEIECSNSELSPEAPNSEPGNAESLNQSRTLQDGKQICDPNEELVQTTPLDAVIFVDSEVKGDEEMRVKEAHVNDTLVAGNAMENASKGSCPKDSQINGYVPQSKSVLRPRLPGKLFKAPGSVSFRRLFPFLKDMMGVGSGMPKIGHCQKDEKGFYGQESKPPMPTESHEASIREHRAGIPSVSNTCKSGVSEGDAVVTTVNKPSHVNVSKLGSSHHSLESPWQLCTKEVISEHLSVPSAKAECLNGSKADSIVDFHCVQEVGIALQNDDLKQDSKQAGVLNEECIQKTPPEIEASDKPEANLKSDSPVLYNCKEMDTTRSDHENVDGGFCLTTDNRKDSILERKSVPRSNLHRKLFKNPGSLNYNRLLPFLMDFTRDEYGHQTHHHKDGVDVYSKGFQLPISSQSQEASTVEHKIDSGSLHGTVESNALVNDILVDPIVEMSFSNQQSSTCSQDLPEVVHECLSSPAVNEHIEKVELGSREECPSDSKFDQDSVMVDFDGVDDVPNALHKDGLEQVVNKISGEHNSESSSKAQNVLHINGNVSDLTFEHHSSKGKGFSIDCDEITHVNPENCEFLGKYLPEGQSLDNMDPNMPDEEDTQKDSRAVCRIEDVVFSNHVSVPNEESGPSPEKIILEKSDMAGHGVHEPGSVLKGIVYVPKMPSKGSSNSTSNRVGGIGSSSESDATLVINLCSRMKLLKHAGSLNYKRMLPYLLNTLEDNSRASANDHCPKVQKRFDQTPLLAISDSDMQVTPVNDSTGCVPVQHRTSSSGTQQQTGLRACDSNGDSSIPPLEVPESCPSQGSWKAIQQLGEQVVLNGRCKLESSEEATRLGPIVNGIIAREEATSASPVRGNSSSLISSNGEKPPVTHECFQSLSQETVLEQPRASAAGFKKGILKRNPRGCRGPCTCLNCASFRLHAERAFEFSRNQFLDAEEVAQDLMKELSNLRNILERSDDSVSINPVSEVKEACRKASVAEQQARDRFSQMNNDLNIHCRTSNLQRPRVIFLDHVEEKVFHPGR